MSTTTTTSPFAGKTLAEIAAALESAPAKLRPQVEALVRTELEARIARPNAKPSSVKRATAALARLTEGASVAIPARPEKAPAEAKAPAAARTTSAKAPARKAKPGDEITLNEAIAIAREYGYPVARIWTAIAKLGANAPRKA